MYPKAVHVLSEETIKKISSIPGIVSPPHNGIRKISGQLLSPPSTESSESIYAPSSSFENVEQIEIPVNLYSPQSLRFIGFDEKTAGRLFEHWVNLEPDEIEVTFLDLVYGQLETLYGKDGDRKQMFQALDEAGVSKHIQDAMMSREYEDIRKTQSIWVWAREIFLTNLQTLESLDSRFQKPDGLRGGAGPQDKDQFYRNLPGSQTLYRATSTPRIADLFGPNGTVFLETIDAGAPVPNDFSNGTTGYYWTDQAWVAERYVGYLKKCCQAAEIVILQMWCPEHLLNGDHVWRLSYSDHWRQLLFFSRKRIPYPEDLEAIWKTKSLIIGPLSINSTPEIRKLSDWTKVTEKNLYVSQGVQATQVVWIGPNAMNSMNEWVKNKVNVYSRFPARKIVDKPVEWLSKKN
ncbi:hypothetical protein K491DRAFT_760961 [Lophiostoma macrostomum CBS 122681]|uniref:Uncharacterized protein n=1 Tax=Lophiostoma macrostomum CBS 122681 TaxID=1314788 RepID=A0A6A6SZA9_9PLEO|nr:hypothetical protein K491DRAFT_760961 [Lophiostoma macrostomum CBS 122681]